MGLSRGMKVQGVLLAALIGASTNGSAQASPSAGSAANSAGTKNRAASEHSICAMPPAMAAKMQGHPNSEASIALGGWFASHRQFGCAVDTFRAAVKADPKSAQLHYLEGLALVGAERPTEAIAALREAIRLEPQIEKPHLMLAYIYDHNRKQPEAEEQWKQALAINHVSERALEGLSAELLARQDPMDVVGLLRAAPRTENLAINLAKALGQLNYLDQANQVLTEALRLTPNSVPLASALTVVLVKQLRYQDAINLLQTTVQKNPGDYDAELQLFRLLVLTNHINLAQPMGPVLLSQHPHDAVVLYLNGLIERIQGDYEHSKAHLEEAITLDPTFFNSRYNLGMVLVFLKDWKKAVDQLEKAIALGGSEPQVHFELAKALHGLGETDRAQDEMKKYQELKKADEAILEASMNAAQGDKELDAGKVQDAVGHYREAAEGAPGNASYKFKFALALHRAGDTPGERVQLEQAIKLDPELAGAQQQLGQLLSEKGDLAEAIEHYKLAVQASPAWTESWIGLAALLAENAQFTEARQAAATALRLDPANTQARELSDQLARDPAAQQAQP